MYSDAHARTHTHILDIVYLAHMHYLRIDFRSSYKHTHILYVNDWKTKRISARKKVDGERGGCVIGDLGSKSLTTVL